MRFNSVNDNSKNTKKALVPIFGREHVRVSHDRGTAYGWINIYVQIPRPADCYCKELERDRDDIYSNYSRCDACQETKELAKRLISAATAEIPFGRWYADDGYNSEYSKTNTTIVFDNEYSYKFGTKDAN